MSALTSRRVNELMSYDETTGDFVWGLERPRKAGTKAGCITSRGYVQICIDGKTYLAHRLAWLVCHDAWPDGEIDHINRIKHDNRLSNLRVVSREENEQNKTALSNNKLGVRGVYYCKRLQRYVTEIVAYGKKKYLGSYATLDEASEAYKMAAAVLHINGAKT